MSTREFLFSELLSAVVDNRGRTCPTSASGIKLIATNCISNDALHPRYEKLRYVSRDTYENWFRGHPEPGDLIFVCKGSPGRVAIAPDPVDFCIAQDMVAVRADRSKVNPLYLFAALRSPEIQERIQNLHVGTMIPHFKKGDFNKLHIPVPDPDSQAGIGNLYYDMSCKIAVNERIASTARQLGLALFVQATLADDLVQTEIESVSSVLTRGIAPKYSESPEDLVVLNQKCIREGRVSLDPARLTLPEKVKGPKLLRRNDVLVNSTGVGTLGRVARWISDDVATVDSHITIVRFDETRVDPVVAGFALLRAQPEIEAMGEGSTGQTELRRAQLGGLEISLPSRTQQQQLRPKLDALEEQADQVLTESLTLATLRDTLLPQLMSGRLRVKDAEKIVEDHT